MSRAFVKEPDGDLPADDLPDRPISRERNLVTRAGHRRLAETLAHWRAQEAALPAEDRAGRARIARELRYWSARWSTAEPVDPPADPEEVGFGTTVELRRAGGRVQTLSLVGEDESAPDEGRIAWTAPLALALIGLTEGEAAQFRGERLEIVSIVPIGSAGTSVA